jgi:hypothetical protein
MGPLPPPVKSMRIHRPALPFPDGVMTFKLSSVAVDVEFQ